MSAQRMGVPWESSKVSDLGMALEKMLVVAMEKRLDLNLVAGLARGMERKMVPRTGLPMALLWGVWMVLGWDSVLAVVMAERMVQW